MSTTCMLGTQTEYEGMAVAGLLDFDMLVSCTGLEVSSIYGDILAAALDSTRS